MQVAAYAARQYAMPGLMVLAGLIGTVSLMLAAAQAPVAYGRLFHLQAAASAPRPNHGEKEVHRTIGGLEDQWHAAALSNDVGTIDRLLADDYVGIGPDGTIASKADELAARRGGLRKLTQFDVVERKIRVYGTTAVVTSRVVVTGMYDAMSLSGEFRYTRVYNLSHGQWRIVSFEASPVTAGRRR